MKPGQPSRTAERVALERAAHQVLDTPRVLEDPFALKVINAGQRATLVADPHSHDRNPFSRPLRALVVVRSRIAEDEIARRSLEGVDQYVVLGAGLDTFAYRQTIPALKVFEVDQPSTQELKKQRLADAGITAPASLTYVPFDFTKYKLSEVLAASGFDTNRAAVFAWLGVAMYLEPHDVDATLSYIGGLPAGTSVIFDYARPLDSYPMVARLFYRQVLSRLEQAGEPWRSFFEPAELRAKLLSLGFTDVDDLGGDEINARYLANRNDGLQARGVAGRIAIARK